MSPALLAEIDLGQAIARQILTLSPQASVADAIALMSAGGVVCSLTCDVDSAQQQLLAKAQTSCVLVVDDTQLVGIFTERDVVHLSASGQSWMDVTIADVMSRSVVTLKQADFTDLFVPIGLFQRHRIRHLPIVDESGLVVGLLTPELIRQLLRPIDLLHLRLVSEVMVSEVVYAESTTPLLAVAQQMATRQVSSVVLVGAERQDEDQATGACTLLPLGIVTERDIVQFHALGLDFSQVLAQTVMSTPVFSVRPETSLWVAHQTMQAQRVSRLIVLGHQKQLLGIVTQTSLLSVLNPLEICQLVETLEQKVSRLEAENLALLQDRNAVLEQQVQARTAALQRQAERERLMARMATEIRASLSLQAILDMAVTTVRSFLQCDRLLVYQFASDWAGCVVAESVGDGWTSALRDPIDDPCFGKRLVALYSAGRTIAIDNINHAGYPNGYRQRLEQYQVKANLVVPILVSGQLWGLLIGHHCAAYTAWQQADLVLLEEIAVQLAIAIQQASAIQQAQTDLVERQQAQAALQQLNRELERRVEERTAALRESEERWALALKGANDAIWDWNVKAQRVFFSSRWMEMRGLTEAEVSDRQEEWLQRIHPEDYDRVMQAVEDHFAGKTEFFELEYRSRRHDGSYLWILDRGQALRDASGEIIRMSGSETDITQRKLADADRSLLLSVLEASLNEIYVFDAITLQFGYANQGAVQNLGYSLEQLKTMTPLQIKPQFTEAEFRQFLQPLLEGQEHKLVIETFHRRAEGSFYPIEAHLQLHEHQGKQFFLAVILDITARKDAETALRELNTALQNTVEGIARLDTRGHYVSVNRAYASACGYEPSAMIGMAWQRTVHPDDLLSLETAYQEMLRTGKVEAEARGLCQDGSLFYKQLMMVSALDEQGTFTGHHCFMKDISDRKRAQEAVRLSEERLQLALEASGDGLWDWNIATDELYLSPQWTEMLGFERYELPADVSLWEQVVHSEDKAWVMERLNAHFNDPSVPYKFDYRLQSKTGEYRWISNYGKVVVRDPHGQPLRMTGTHRDISASKQVEAELRQTNEQLAVSNAELARATRLKDEFLANMSHELRTPLNAILGMSEALQDEVFGVMNERQLRSLATIERSGTHLLALINDILDVSKIEAGKLELEIGSVSVKQLCESSLSFIKQQAAQKSIRLELQLQPGLGNIFVDERRMRQVLINLLNNAVKFTPSGGQVTLAVHLERSEACTVDCAQSLPAVPCALCFSVFDTGIGITAADQAKLFQAFVQIDSSLNRQYAGTGLGLMLVRQLVELHGGSVTVNSEVGTGSCFTLRLPHVCQAANVTTALAPSPSIDRSVVAPIDRVLLVEDSTIASEQVARYLRELGIEAVIHPHGEGTVEESLRLQPALIILDLLLPNQSGWETLAQLKAHPQTKVIPVLILSVVDERSRGLAMGAAEYLIKPVTRRQFQTMLEQLWQPSLQQPPMLIADQSVVDRTMSPQVKQPLLLLAEDNEADIVTFSSYLGSRGYRLIVAKHGQAAIDLAIQHTPDLILMDVQMPGMDGLEAIRQLRAEESLSKIPIIAVTALATPQDHERCLKAGATEYLAKPVRLKQLAMLIQQLLEQKGLK